MAYQPGRPSTVPYSTRVGYALPVLMAGMARFDATPGLSRIAR